jgi:hypothetical protein
MRRRIMVLIVTLIACGCLPVTAGAAETATLHASFSPDRLGAGTTIGFGFQIVGADGGVPAPLTSLSLRLPAGIDYVSTTLGLAVCRPASLLARGLAGCSPNSRLGSGSAVVETPFGQGSGHETSEVHLLMGPPHDNNLVVLFYTNGLKPISSQIVFQGELASGSETLGGSLDAAVPLIPSLPGSPPVSILSVQSTIGPSHLTYYTHSHGKTVAFRPQGVAVPLHCPQGGFPFSASFGFSDATSTVATSTVPCPPSSTRK